MTWTLSVQKENSGGHYVHMDCTSYTEDHTLLPAEARRLAAALMAEANEADKRNRPPVKPFWK